MATGPGTKRGLRLFFGLTAGFVAVLAAVLFLPLPVGADCRFGAALEGVLEQDGQPVFPGREWVKLASPESAGFSSQDLKAVAARIKRMDTTCSDGGQGWESIAGMRGRQSRQLSGLGS